ncbi:hypothetical protein CLU79DRAFT_560034 [Phycomyces nitens]|nr:hypothetical protein CLU79DRAFT_560034 [Phycomyces nitens]
MQSENTLNVQPSWNVHDAALELLNDAIVSHNRTQPRNGDAGFTSGPNTSTEPDKEKEDTDTILKAGLSKRVFETDQDELSNSAAKRPGRKPLDEAAAKVRP